MKQPKKKKTFPSAASTPAVASVRSTSQLARELGLSRWTISRVINNHPGIHPDTVARVREAMRQHRFSPNPLAQGLRSGRTNVIGICAPDIEDYFLGPKLEQLRHALSAAGYQVMIGLTDGEEATEEATLDHFRRLCVSGVVLFASRLSRQNAAITSFEEAGIALLRVDPHLAAGSASLRVDRAHASREVLRHLLALGHRSFATLGIDGLGPYTRIRLQAIRAVLKERADCAPLLELPLPEVENLYAAGAALAPRLASLGAERPTALLALNDRVALGVINGLGKAGLAVPRDCSVVGYDNMDFTSYALPPLTTVDTGAPELMQHAATTLLEAIRAQPGTVARLPVIKPTLVVRETTASPPLVKQ